MRVLFAGATGVIGHGPFPVLTAAGHQVIGLARRPGRLGDGEVVAADALDRAAVARRRSAAPTSSSARCRPPSPTRSTPGTWPATWP